MSKQWLNTEFLVSSYPLELSTGNLFFFVFFFVKNGEVVSLSVKILEKRVILSCLNFFSNVCLPPPRFPKKVRNKHAKENPLVESYLRR